MRLLVIILALFLLPWEEGGITFYYGEPFEGSNLKCPGYRYERETGPWVALDITKYESGEVQCGDWILVEFYDGTRMMARALDSGHLAGAEIWDTGKPFVADLPRYWREGRETRTGRIVNISALFRRMEVTTSNVSYAK